MHSNDVTNFFKKAVSIEGAKPIPLGENQEKRSVSVSMADFDEEAYRPYLSGLDVTDEQASELMRVVWNIMRMWVEMDLPADNCGQIIERVIIPPASESDSLP